MALFDSVVGDAAEKFGLSGEKAGGLLAALLGLITTGGFKGFLDRFRNAGLGGAVDSWISTGDNTPLSRDELTSALGDETIRSVAGQAGVEPAAAGSAMAAMIPQVVDHLTPDGTIPDEAGLLSKIGGFLSDLGGAGAIAGGLGATSAAAGGTFDRIEKAAVEPHQTQIAPNVVETDGGTIIADNNDTAAVSRVDERSDDEGSILRWLLPLLLLGLLIALGFWFCGKSQPVTTTTNVNVNSNASRPANTASNANSTAQVVDSSFKIVAKDGKYIVSGVVPDEATKKQIVDALTAQYGAGNIDFAGLRVDAAAKPFAVGWWNNFTQMLPNLKDWKTGTLAFAGNAITEAAGLPANALAQLKSLFGTGWKLPVSIAGADATAKQANEEALKGLNTAGTVDEVVKALNVSIINFDSGSSAIPADAKPILDKAAEVLKKQGDGATIEIGGHTDSDGNDEANMKLSQTRADSVKKALVALGVKDLMLTAKGYGESAPVTANDTSDNKFKNRRIEYKTGTGASPTATVTTNTNSTK